MIRQFWKVRSERLWIVSKALCSTKQHVALMVGRGIEAACCFFVLARYLLFKQGYRFHMTCLWKHIHYSGFNQFITQFVNQDSGITGER